MAQINATSYAIGMSDASRGWPCRPETDFGEYYGDYLAGYRHFGKRTEEIIRDVLTRYSTPEQLSDVLKRGFQVNGVMYRLVVVEVPQTLVITEETNEVSLYTDFCDRG